MPKLKKTRAIEKYDKARLANNAGIGMSKVDPADIRPPRILLMQKSSSLTDFVDHMGKTPKVGQFFHTGKMRIFETIKCNFLFAAKSQYKDTRQSPAIEKDQYQTLAILTEDQSLFAMAFRSSALFALSPVFGVAASEKVPMFSINCEIETKELTGEKGTWLVPVVRILGMEKDAGRLTFLEEFAKQFDAKADELSKKDLTKTEEGDEESQNKTADWDPH